MLHTHVIESLNINGNIIPVHLCCDTKYAKEPFYLRSIHVINKIPAYIKHEKIDPANLKYIEVIQIPEASFQDGACLLWISIIAHEKSGTVHSGTIDQFHINMHVGNMNTKYDVYPQRPHSFWEWDTPEDNEAYNGL